MKLCNISGGAVFDCLCFLFLFLCILTTSDQHLEMGEGLEQGYKDLQYKLCLVSNYVVYVLLFSNHQLC